MLRYLYKHLTRSLSNEHGWVWAVLGALAQMGKQQSDSNASGGKGIQEGSKSSPLALPSMSSAAPPISTPKQGAGALPLSPSGTPGNDRTFLKDDLSLKEASMLDTPGLEPGGDLPGSTSLSGTSDAELEKGYNDAKESGHTSTAGSEIKKAVGSFIMDQIKGNMAMNSAQMPIQQGAASPMLQTGPIASAPTMGGSNALAMSQLPPEVLQELMRRKQYGY